MRATLITAGVISTSIAAAAAATTTNNNNNDRPRTWSEDSDNPLPLVIWHGLGDSASGEGLAEIAQLAHAIAPGILVHIVNPNKDGGDDRTATFFGNVTEQVQTVCDQLASDPILSTAPAIDAIGFSQGGQFLRGYIERCNFPPVRNLITFGSQHNGITEFRECGTTDLLCQGAMALLRFNVWSAFVQGRVVPAQYFRSTEGDAYRSYLDSSNFLADINNERDLKNKKYKKNLASLDNFVMYLFANDTVSIPKESSWFGEITGDGNHTPLKEQPIYKEDWLGLKKLDEKGALKFKTIEGDHMQIPAQVLNDTLTEFLGPFKGKVSESSGDFESDEL
ncbi:hypothetical protein QQS21_000289 [Conoideocrella luteorostrata]|uniref:Palmitoyl-protein thioesterase 1 n=1 Tax=Conoideocrella luteorostrata TaxID=1105319 RepID=A0AAJ0G2Z1_9HYPO|nr:hypothetical protein QQS21_000289 [Conoideocrella luteorostrata]